MKLSAVPQVQENGKQGRHLQEVVPSSVAEEEEAKTERERTKEAKTGRRIRKRKEFID